MSKWEMVKLGEMFKITSGGTPSKGVPEYYKNGTIPWVKTGDLKGQYIDILSVDKITELGLNNSSAKVFPKHTVLIAMYGATIGATAILPTEASTNQACAAFLPSDRVSSEYLYYFLYSHKTKIISLGVGGAQPNISATILKQIEIPIPPLDEQKRIAEELDKISGLIAKRKNQLEKLDLLVKAKFVEMFGDPVKNPMGWEKELFLNLGKCKNGMNFGANESGFRVHCLGVGDFKDLSTIVDTSALSCVSLDKLPSEDYLLKDGDIVFVRSNGNKELVGRCLVIYPGDITTTFSGFCIRYRMKTEKLNISYLLQVLKHQSIRKQMAGRGANIQNLNQQILGTLEIPLPPVALQNQFANYVTKVEQTKTKLQHGLEQLETLYKARMQEYFE